MSDRLLAFRQGFAKQSCLEDKKSNTFDSLWSHIRTQKSVEPKVRDSFAKLPKRLNHLKAVTKKQIGPQCPSRNSGGMAMEMEINPFDDAFCFALIVFGPVVIQLGMQIIWCLESNWSKDCLYTWVCFWGWVTHIRVGIKPSFKNLNFQ